MTGHCPRLAALTAALVLDACTVTTGFEEYGFEEPSREAPSVVLDLLGCNVDDATCQCERTARGGEVCAFEWEVVDGPPAYKLPVYAGRVRLEARARCQTCSLERVELRAGDSVLLDAAARAEDEEAFDAELSLGSGSFEPGRLVVEARATTAAGRTGGDAQTLVLRR